MTAEVLTLFGDDPEWVGMPEFTRHDRRPVRHLTVNFETVEDYAEFGRLVGQPLTPQTDNIWFPEMPRNKLDGVKRYSAKRPVHPRHPIYVVSKGRADRCLTSRILHKLGVVHFVVVEEPDFVAYTEELESSARVIVLPSHYRQEYDPCDDRGDAVGTGPGPARNFAWDHAADAGEAWHWVMDDNISRFHRLNHNLKVPVADGTMFAAMEDFAARYENVAMAGPAYHGLTKQRDRLPPYVLNTRIYSCNLIRTDAPYRWRGRYNEDTDLSLRMLKDGLVTVQFNAFLQEKVMTGRMSGGNKAEFYADEGTSPKSQMLADLHPDVAIVAWKFGRWHHHVDYSRFKANIPKRRAGVTVRDGTDDFGMVYEERIGEQWEPA
jgi:hypothetical protein